MTSNRFFIKQSQLESSTVIIYGEEHHHLSKVARIKPGEKIWLFDEKGTSYLACVEEIRKDMTKLSILEKKNKDKLRVAITLAQSLIKSKKMELIIQKSTELGVATIIPVITERSIVNIEGKVEKKIERWKKISCEAAKQSHSLIPAILIPTLLSRLISERDEEKKILLSEHKGRYLRDLLIRSSASGFQIEEPPASVLILIGPEGGWTKEEEVDILNHGFERVSLGQQILRAETAAVCSLSIISHFWNL